jgi:lipoate-protein ligase A
LSTDWRLLDISYDSVYKNLALEEALITCHESDEETPKIRLWCNPPAVVAGRFQDIRLEADVSMCERIGIKIARRFTGGGTVYHDQGNLNFTLIGRESVIDLQDVQNHNISILKETLSQLGVESTIVPPNSISVHGRKISGASAAVRHNCVLWHASLLVSTDLETVSQVLSPSRENFSSNRVRSKWQPVTNLQTSLSRAVEVSEVKTQILKTIENMFDIRVRRSQLSSSEEDITNHLHDLKYTTAEWNNEGIVP